MIAPSIDMEACPAGTVPVHRHDAPHACIVLTGEMLDKCWGRSGVPAAAGELILNPAGTTHAIEADASGFECLVIEWPQTKQITRLQRFHKDRQFTRILTLSESLKAENPARKQLTELEIGAAIDLSISSDDTMPACWLTEARNAIDPLHENFSVSGLARHAGVHRATLSQQFRAAYGISPEKYKMLLKLERAVEGLISGNSIADAAFSSGFTDQAHLTRAWARYLGSTPGKWKRTQTTIMQDFCGEDMRSCSQ